LLLYLVLYFDWLTVPHKTPLSGARRLKGPRADFLPVLGLTPSVATLLCERPDGSQQLQFLLSFQLYILLDRQGIFM